MTRHDNGSQGATLIHAGAGRGARALLPHMARWSQMHRFPLEAAYVDPVPGRAEGLRREAERLGLRVRAEEEAIEGFLERSDPLDPRSVLVLSLDRPRSIARALEASSGIPTLAHSVWQFPTGHVAGFRTVLAPEDEAARRRLAALFLSLSGLTARAGSEAIFGAQAIGSGRASEPLQRAGFGRHLARNLPKLAAGLEPEDPSATLALAGARAEPAVIIESPREWKSREALLDEGVFLDGPVPPGRSLLLLELGATGLRVHRARLRRVDRKFDLTTVTGAELPLPAEEEDVPATEKQESPERGRTGLPALGLTAGALLLTD